ncbi:MAG: 50S ribosomal protein L15 [Candidatus Taylorbacteria bacterium RIFCSPHIGHO2_02_FULL_44_36]|uniref:Large ribosomal subunit protein uL15 n=1 Tax=Candidatus Taylorbacteria bacterium RIFCSPLOWO2_12_FULL_44_15c TaxID=1802333 RepID=A0A1G2P9E2_9BACT|nr:MAG: 50S ribosomal protein L15 [Candidatus Taylorbacteria bacterium RIFCSPHIGHO2_02_FULL_44_36]OHA39095.1 MAG: 50S ribosomal protein L15 [Candidatus Taylorbacteria bacterium RIFCSPLOWO2_02_FULL_44_35]OHA44272.1 MAG: 50S ribosomal protein L15 [Candidatus Taylorbacteria bacterium RIFCSPLOWO2_12_FULL_44_15c]
MQLHNLKRKNPNRRSISVGRGGRRGKTSGRGGKGQTARAGHKIRPEIRDLIKKLPKLRGRGKNINRSFEKRPAVFNVGVLEKKFAEGETVNPTALIAKNLLRLVSGQLPKVKILGNGQLSKKLFIERCLFSQSAKTAIEKAGGSIKLV